MSPAISWNALGHTTLSALGLLTLIPTPVTMAIGIAANLVNAVWFASEGNYFEAVCSAVGALGGSYSFLNVTGLASKCCTLTSVLKNATAVGSIAIGGIDIARVGYGNYQKYVVRGEDFSLADAAMDAGRIVLDSTSIAAGIKLFSEPVPKNDDSLYSLDYRAKNREYLSGGGRIATVREVRRHKQTWNEQGINVVEDLKGNILPPDVAAGFDYSTGVIVIRQKPTLPSLYHEGFHAQQFLELGKDEYMAISMLAREEYVYSQLVSSGLCNEAELLNAKAYIERLRFGEVWK